MSLLAAASLSTYASEAVFSYGSMNEHQKYFGYDKSEIYDVAIYIPGTALEGAQITGIKVAVPQQANLSNCSGWLSDELNLKRNNGKYVNDPDICIKEATISNGELTVTFDTPYTLTAKGVYAGYSFRQEETNTENAVAVSTGTNLNGLWMHASRSKMKWTQISSECELISDLKIMMSGNFAANAAAFAIESTPIVSREDEVWIPAKVVNYGLDEIRSIEYTYTTPSGRGKGEIRLPHPVAASLGASTAVEVNAGILDQNGMNDITLTITTVNGTTNGCVQPSVASAVKAVPFIPVNRPLFEEYTGLWCGWCPRGYVALEVMKERYDNIFIGIAYHSRDAMTCLRELPNNSVWDLPAAFLNRSQKIDPGDIYEKWETMRNEIPTADIDVTLEWADETKTQLRATSAVRFIEDVSAADYRVSYLLVGDGLSDPRWIQKNYYAGASPEKYPALDDNQWGRIFLYGQKQIAGLTFNDIALAASEYEGVRGSIPSEITAGEVYKHEYVFNLPDVVNSSGENIINNPDKLRVVAVVNDASKDRFINCNSSLHVDGTTAINPIEPTETKSELIHTTYFDITGRHIPNPAKGLYIRVDQFSNGTHKTSKVLK